MRISDWSSDVCSSPLDQAGRRAFALRHLDQPQRIGAVGRADHIDGVASGGDGLHRRLPVRSEEHTSELQSLMRISYAVFCLKKKKQMVTTSSKALHRIKMTII